jgi:D-alanyl-D-alanine carboxypeptidase (penicillin-binding protein 5/6)
MRKLTGIFRVIFLVAPLLFSTSYAGAENRLPNLADVEFYLLIDADTKEILLANNIDVRVSPSSMTKMMTAYVVFDEARLGNISLNHQCLIGKDAWRKSGSSMFLNYGDVVTVDKLVRGLLTVSGNDAAIALAEATGGGYDNFIDLMNKKAQEIGLTNSRFQNPHGLNQKGHYMSLRDLATLMMHIYQEFPQYSHYFNLQKFTYGNITQRNRNPLIKSNYEGILGGKTGYTNRGGYGVIGMVKRDRRRLVAVINKAKSPRQRSKVITEILDYGFSNFKKLALFEKGQEVAKIPTWLGLKDEVAVVTNRKVVFSTLRSRELDDVKVKVKFLGPLKAPVAKGAKVADLIIEMKGRKTLQYSLFAKERIDKVGILEKISIISKYKFNNFINKNF